MSSIISSIISQKFTFRYTEDRVTFLVITDWRDNEAVREIKFQRTIVDNGRIVLENESPEIRTSDIDEEIFKITDRKRVVSCHGRNYDNKIVDLVVKFVPISKSRYRGIVIFDCNEGEENYNFASIVSDRDEFYRFVEFIKKI